MCAISRANDIMAMSPSMLPQACKFGCEVLEVMHALSQQLIWLLLVDSCEQNIEIIAADLTVLSNDLKDLPRLPVSNFQSTTTALEIEMFQTSATVTSRRLPIMAIMKVDPPQTNREKAVENAIKKLRKQRGFSNFERKHVLKIKYKERNGNVFAVVLNFYLRFLQENGDL